MRVGTAEGVSPINSRQVQSEDPSTSVICNFDQRYMVPDETPNSKSKSGVIWYSHAVRRTVYGLFSLLP
jgi:hypothetical protein